MIRDFSDELLAMSAFKRLRLLKSFCFMSTYQYFRVEPATSFSLPGAFQPPDAAGMSTAG
jgi:hypothetical protein